MINLSAMMGRITGQSAESGVHPGAPAGGEAGTSAASGGAFAALVQLVARTGQPSAQAEAGLVVETGAVLAPDGAIALSEDAGAPTADPGMALPGSGKVTAWPQFADARSTPHKAATMTKDGHGLRAGPRPAVAPMIAVTPVLLPDENGTTATTGDGAIAEGVDDGVAGDTLKNSILAGEHGPVQASIPTIPIGAAVVAAPAAWVGQQAAEVVRPSGSPDLGEAVEGNGRPLRFVTRSPTALAVDARPEGNVRLSAQPAVRTPVKPGETDGAVNGTAREQADQGASVPAGLSGSRASEQGAVGSVAPASGLGVPGGAMPLRMIVESLPPVVQSALTAGAVATVSGPSTGQQLGDQVIDMGVSGQWIDRIAREITALAEGGGHSRFTLNPPHLGRLQVDLWQGQDATSVRFIAETDEAARRLGEGRTALQTDARLVALNLGSVTIEKSALPQESPRDAGGQRPGSETQQQAAGQGQAQGQNQAKAGSGQAQGDGIARPLREEQDQQGDASPTLAARRAANGHVRFA